MTTLRAFVTDRYWPTFKDGLCPRWQRNTEKLLEHILGDLGDLNLNAISIETLERWNVRLRKRYSSPVTPNKCLTRLRHILKAAVRWGLLADNAATHIKKVKEPLRKFRPLADTERQLIYKEASPMLEPYIFWGHYTGARLSSLYELEEQYVDLSRLMITFKDTKNGEDYHVPLHPTLAHWCVAHFTGTPTARVLPQYKDRYIISRSFARLKRRLGITNFRFHDLRHEVGSSLAQAGAHPKHIMEVLGHKDIKMSLRYTHVRPEEVRQFLCDGLK